MSIRRAVWFVVFAILLAACDYHLRVETPVTPSAVPVTTPTPSSDAVIEFRIDGDLSSPVIVRVSNGLDGLSQVTSVLPFSQTITISGRDSLFLSLEGRGTGTGFLHAGIYVNGVIFREASSATLFNPLVTVSGTWRRSR